MFNNNMSPANNADKISRPSFVSGHTAKSAANLEGERISTVMFFFYL